MDEAEIIIARLGLALLPDEGGFFRRTWTAPAAPGARPAGTSIPYLVTPAGFSAMHRLQTDEIWHFHAGDPLALMWLTPARAIERVTLGADIAAGHQPQAVVPGGACPVVRGRARVWRTGRRGAGVWSAARWRRVGMKRNFP